MKKRIYIIIVVILFSLFTNYLNTDNGLKDNFYLTINKDIIEKNVLEEGEYSWSYFLEAQERVDEDTDLLVKDILEGNASELDIKEIDTIERIYNKAIDIDKRNKDGIKDLNTYIDKVWKVDSVSKLVDVIILIENELGIDILSNIEVLEDYQDNSRNIIYFVPVTFAFGASSDYIVNDDYMAYKAYIRRACIQLWKAYGYDTKEAREIVSRVFSFYEGVANVSMLSEELSDIDAYYNVVSEDEVNGIYNNVEGKYLERIGLVGKDVYSLVDKEQYKYFNESLVSDNIDVWKYVIITKILSSYASYGSSDYVEVVNNLNEGLLGSSKDNDIETQALEIVKGLFSEEIDIEYSSKYLIEEDVLEIEKMFLDIKRIFGKRLRDNDWLSEDAKNKALLKLEEMDIVIGVDDGVNGYEMASELDVSSGSLISDIIKMQKIARKKDLERLDRGSKVMAMEQTSVNAYYQLLDNSIVIPVAFFELVDDYNDTFEKLGTIGMIIAHEVTHAFDGNGSKFDEVGNMNNWWSDEDREVFKRLSDEVVDYYSSFEVIEGKHINGEKTVNENIADLGALACIVEIAKDNDASHDEFKKMFEAFASVWASRESEEYMELLLLQDVHAPNEFRVNAVLSSIEEFYQVYYIYPLNDMWISKNDRVMVW